MERSCLSLCEHYTLLRMKFFLYKIMVSSYSNDLTIAVLDHYMATNTKIKVTIDENVKVNM